ncbi:carboxymuconolactone decarboxylase family protein [Bordetella sp. FB-8]|uniref:carboxymuconolactone decarboxylase family protein n=1 Tax=Bordetella sp. FB-8 TaxID=1159870 RepID=UPI00037FC211|nr:carboxymuconolactone decarboxylase family protein [Bordetella sp. FB-8]
MKTLRLEYSKLSPQAYAGLIATNKALDYSSLGKELIELVNLRVSQINGCAFCLEMHAKSSREGGVPDAKIDSVAGWRVSAHFSERERAALHWAESLAHVDQTHAPDDAYESLKAHFSDAEISDLTFVIALMSAFNRLAIGMRQ